MYTMYLALAAIFMAVVFLFMVVTPPRGRETGFKQCNKCGKNKMSLTDPHTLCFRCLGPDHLYQSCNQCKGLLPDSRSRRARRQIIWKVSQLLDPPPQKLSQMAARELALTYMSHTQVQEYTVFGNSGGTRDEDCVDSNSLAGQGDAVHTGVALLASSDRGPVSRLTLDSFGFDAHFANGKEMSHGSTGARQGRYTLDAPRGGSMAFDPARTSDGRPPIGTVQGPSLLAGGAEASARSCSDPFAAASNAWQSRGLESQGTFDSNLSRQVPIDVPTPVPGTSTLPFGFVEAFQPVSRVETTVVDLTRMVQENVQQALGGVDRKIDLIFKAMANMSTGVPGLGGVEPIDPPQLQIDPLLAPIPLGPRDLGKVDPVRDKVPLGGSAASMSGIDVSQSTARPLERAPDNWSYDRTMSHYLTKLGATDMVSRPAPVVDPMLHIAGQTRSTAAPGGLLLDESRAKMLSSIFGAPEAVARTAPGNSRFRMEPELFSKAFVAPQLDGAIADKIKRANKGFVPRSEVNHWVAALGPLYESAMASFRLAYHQLWMIRGLHTDLDVSPPEHQAALVQHLMASALESLTNSARGAVNTLVLLRSMLLSLTDYSKEKSVQSRLTALPFRGTLVFGEDFLALLRNLSADTLALKQSDQVLSGPTPAKIPRVSVQPQPIKAKTAPKPTGLKPKPYQPEQPFRGGRGGKGKAPAKSRGGAKHLGPPCLLQLTGVAMDGGRRSYATTLTRRGATQTVSASLGVTNHRPVGTGDCQGGLQASVCNPTPTFSRTSRDPCPSGQVPGGPPSGGDPGSARQAGHRGDRCEDGPPGVLLTLFPGVQKDGRVQTYPQSEGAESAYPLRQVSHGHVTNHSPGPGAGRLDGITGLERCISSCANIPGSQEVPTICFQGPPGYPESLSVDGVTLRAVYLPEGVHQGPGPYRGSATCTGPFYVPVHRRLIQQQCSISIDPTVERCLYNTAAAGGFHYQPEKVEPDPDTGHGPFRSQTVNGKRDSSPAPGQGRRHCDEGLDPEGDVADISQGRVTRHWFDDSLHSNGASLHAIRQTSDDASAEALYPWEGFDPKTDFSRRSNLPSSPVLLDRGDQPPAGGSSGLWHAEGGDFHRCISPRLGSGMGLPDSEGDMGLPRQESPYKSPGNEGSAVSSVSFPGTNPRFVCTDTVRQYHGGGIHKQGRWNAFPVAECHGQEPGGLVDMLPGNGSSSPCGRGGQRTGRRPLEGGPGPGTERLEVHGMVPGPVGGRQGVSTLGSPRRRSLCDQAEQEGRLLLQSPSRCSGSEPSGPVHTMGQGSDVYLPPDVFGSPESSKDSTGGGGCHSHSAMLASPGLVSFIDPALDRAPNTVAAKQKVANRSGGRAPPGPSNPPPSRLESLGEDLQAAGVSEQAANTCAAALRPSTKSLYHAKWKTFCGWCAERDINPAHVSVTQVVNYLQSMADLGLKYNTICTHVSALSSCMQPIGGRTLGSFSLITKWLKGYKALKPPVRLLIPPWELGIVLSALRDQPYEPLRKADMRLVTLKLAFLLSVTSARRISEIHALGVDNAHLVLNPQSAILRVNRSFLPKTKTDIAINSKLELQAFYPEPKNHFENQQRLNCPIRALRIYLRRSNAYRKDNALFVNFDKRSLGKSVSKSMLSKWLSQVIRDAYEINGREAPIKCNPHSIRGIASSWAEVGHATPSEIAEAGTWSNLLTFATFYRLDYLGSSFGTSILKAVGQTE